MGSRRYTLRLQILDEEVFYCWTYNHAVQNCSKSFGIVHENGSLHDLSYEHLRKLGDGSHVVEMDEANKASCGSPPATESKIDRQRRALRFCRFMHDDGLLIRYFLLNVSRENTEAFIEELSGRHIDELHRIARETPKSEIERISNPIVFLSSHPEILPDLFVNSLAIYPSRMNNPMTFRAVYEMTWTALVG